MMIIIIKTDKVALKPVELLSATTLLLLLLLLCLVRISMWLSNKRSHHHQHYSLFKKCNVHVDAYSCIVFCVWGANVEPPLIVGISK